MAIGFGETSEVGEARTEGNFGDGGLTRFGHFQGAMGGLEALLLEKFSDRQTESFHKLPAYRSFAHPGYPCHLGEGNRFGEVPHEVVNRALYAAGVALFPRGVG